MTARTTLARLGVLMGAVFVDMLGFLMVLPLLPFYAERMGADAVIVGVLVAVFAAAHGTAPITPIGNAAAPEPKNFLLLKSTIKTPLYCRLCKQARVRNRPRNKSPKFSCSRQYPKYQSTLWGW